MSETRITISLPIEELSTPGAHSETHEQLWSDRVQPDAMRTAEVLVRVLGPIIQGLPTKTRAALQVGLPADVWHRAQTELVSFIDGRSTLEAVARMTCLQVSQIVPQYAGVERRKVIDFLMLLNRAGRTIGFLELANLIARGDHAQARVGVAGVELELPEDRKLKAEVESLRAEVARLKAEKGQAG